MPEENLSGSIDVLHSLRVTEGMEGLDCASKELYKNKEVLTIILKGVVREFRDYSYPEIMEFIEGDSITDCEHVSPGHRHAGAATRIIGDDKEFVVLDEKLSVFDTKFRAVNPELSGGKITVNLHIDLEMQLTYRPGYPVEKRGLYYLARELASQLSVVTSETDYGCLEKCYSIWICRDDVPEEEKFSISLMEMNNTKNYGNCRPNRADYDLLTLVVIRLGDSVFREMEEKEVNGMMEFLHAIMYPHTEEFLTKIKKYIDFSENEELWKEVDSVTGLGMSIGRECYEKGHSAGLEEGRKSGLEEGRKSGLEEGRRSGLEEGRRSGLEEGRRSGLKEGLEEEKKEVAFRMFSMNQTPEMVSNTIKKPMEYTLELQKKYLQTVNENSAYTTE